MKKLSIALIILTISIVFKITFSHNEFSPDIKEEPQMLTRNVEKKIRLEFADKEILVLLENNASAYAFYDRLPLEFEFKDYAYTEKVTDLVESLPKPEGNFGYEPKHGDFAYYAPWKGLAFYYKDFQYSIGLIKLGEIVEGLDDLTNMEGIVLVSKADL